MCKFCLCKRKSLKIWCLPELALLRPSSLCHKYATYVLYHNGKFPWGDMLLQSAGPCLATWLITLCIGTEVRLLGTMLYFYAKTSNVAVGKLQIPAVFLQSFFIGCCPLCRSLMSNLKLVLISLCQMTEMCNLPKWVLEYCLFNNHKVTFESRMRLYTVQCWIII
jgi:hypothetical protein